MLDESNEREVILIETVYKYLQNIICSNKGQMIVLWKKIFIVTKSIK